MLPVALLSCFSPLLFGAGGAETPLSALARDIRDVKAAVRAVYEALPAPAAVWSEVTAPRIEIGAVRFRCRDQALVIGNEVQYGSLIVKRSRPVTLILKRQGGRWNVVFRESPVAEAYRL